MGFENGKLVRVILRATNGTDQQVNTFHYDLDDGTGTAPNDPQSLADTFRDDVRPSLATLYKSTWTLQPVEVVEEKDPLHPTDPRSAWTSGAPLPGTMGGSADLLPPGAACVVSLTTAHIGRRFRGRTWLSGTPAEDWQHAGVWETANMTAFAAIMATVPHEPDIAPPLSDATAKWCVYSRTQRAANLDPYASAITGVQVRTLVHNLRSRTLYG